MSSEFGTQYWWSLGLKYSGIKTRKLSTTRWRIWSRHYATSRKVADSSPDEVDFFNLPNPSSRTMALGSTQPVTEMSTRNIGIFLGVKGGWHVVVLFILCLTLFLLSVKTILQLTLN
jgi:hypothetical protein